MKRLLAVLSLIVLVWCAFAQEGGGGEYTPAAPILHTGKEYAPVISWKKMVKKKRMIGKTVFFWKTVTIFLTPGASGSVSFDFFIEIN